LFFYGPAVITTLRFLGAPVAPATTLKLAPVGTTRIGGQKVHTLIALLEVRPAQGQPFQAEMLVPVRDQNLARARAGEILRVKYLPGDPPRLIYHGPA
jgi:hypothetical protein